MTKTNDDDHFAHLLSGLNSEKFQMLRPAQQRVLGQYLEEFENTADVAVQLPTGAGKTLIALLIAERRRQGGEKVAILSANKNAGPTNVTRIYGVGDPVCFDGRIKDIYFKPADEEISQSPSNRHHELLGVFLIKIL